MTESATSSITGRKKILFLITKSNWGGAQKYVFDLATGLPRDLFEIKVALGGNGLLKQKLQEHGVDVIQIPSLIRDINIFSDLKVLLEIVQIIKNEKPDILHVNSSKISGLGSFAGRILNVKKTVFTAHGWAFNENRSGIAKLIIKTAYLLTLWFADETICVSKKLTEQIKGWPINKKKLHIIHNGIAVPNFVSHDIARNFLIKTIIEKSTLTKIAQPELNGGTIWFGTIGELHHIKGHIYAIRAFAEIAKKRPDLKFIFIILSEGEIRKTLEEEITNLDLESRILLPGHIENGAQYLKAFDYFLFPSLSEGLPYTILEAGFAGLPVISSKVGGIPEIMTNNENGILVPSQDPIAIEEAIYTYLDNPEIAKKYATALNQRVTTEFSIEKMIQETQKVYLSGGNSK